VDAADLQVTLAGLRAEDPDLSVILRGDGQTPYRLIRAVLDACQQANVAKLDLATDPVR
jgi:biopolymer transport protein ExbD